MVWNSNYSYVTGLWKSLKDAASTAVALALGGAFAVAVQVETQCPELSIVAFGSAIGIKTVVQFLNNYRKHNS